jgi:succinate-semialdehyde dehydrogenase/glutarate-semialdehyde dehydrogenase
MNNPEARFMKTGYFIGGKWGAGASSFPVFNPANGEFLAQVANCSERDAEDAVRVAFEALPTWKGLLAKERAALLEKWAALVALRQEELARLLTLEQGKPLAEARSEVGAAAEAIKWAAEEAPRTCGQVIPEFKSGTKVLVLREAVGVCAAITPWNFPSAMVTRKVAPALAAGCCVVLKPAEDTPLSALALAALAEEAGLPAGVLNVLPCDGARAPEIGRVLCSHEAVRKITFTGSTEVGRILMRQAATGLKRISLELGGNAPFLVFESADLEKAAEGAILSKFRNAGQTCICANRILVQNSVLTPFTEILSRKIKLLKVGFGLDPDTKIGPLINQDAVQKVQTHIQDALGQGGALVCGGHPLSPGSLFFEPTLLTNLHAGMKIFSEETFGPLAGIFPFEDEKEALRLANATEHGLAAYVYSQDMGQCFRVPGALEAGMIAVNEPFLSNAAIPFGGVKHSGFGREGGPSALEPFLETKYVLVGY